MESWSRIARGARSDTNLVCFYTTIDHFIAALAFKPTCVAHAFCPTMAAKRS